MIRRAGAALLWLGTVLLLAGCGREKAGQDLFPGREVVPGWVPADEVQTFDADNLYDLVDGQADSFFVYGFQQVHVQTYQNGAGGQVRIEIWQMDNAGNAYGLYTMLRSGVPVSIGNLGDADPGRRVDFWQDRAFVRVFSFAPESAGTLDSFADSVSGALPQGGQRPILMGRLPEQGLVERSEVFFHQETSIQGLLWLGGQNLLSLNADTNGVLARYLIQDAAVWLLLVEYPAESAATEAWKALATYGFDDLSAVAAEGPLLGAVFGAAPVPSAEQLLMVALDGGGE